MTVFSTELKIRVRSTYAKELPMTIFSKNIFDNVTHSPVLE